MHHSLKHRFAKKFGDKGRKKITWKTKTVQDSALLRSNSRQMANGITCYMPLILWNVAIVFQASCYIILVDLKSLEIVSLYCLVSLQVVFRSCNYIDSDRAPGWVVYLLRTGMWHFFVNRYLRYVCYTFHFLNLMENLHDRLIFI